MKNLTKILIIVSCFLASCTYNIKDSTIKTSSQATYRQPAVYNGYGNYYQTVPYYGGNWGVWGNGWGVWGGGGGWQVWPGVVGPRGGCYYW